MHHPIFPALLLAAAVVASPAAAQTEPAADAAAAPGPTSKDALKYRSGLPVPRFASLRSSKANLRAGPGNEYPVTWVYIRPGTPLEILSEWNVWRKVRDAAGTEGWMNRAMLAGTRTIQITGAERQLHARPDATSPIVLRAEPGVVMRVTMCAQEWCRVEGEGRSGYLRRSDGFGVYPNETIG